MKKLMLPTRKELKAIVSAETDELSITKGQLSKVVPDQLRPGRQDLPTGKATVDHFSAGSFNIKVNTFWPTLLFLTMAQDFRKIWFYQLELQQKENCLVLSQLVKL